MIKNFWNNFDSALNKANKDENSLYTATLDVSFIVIAITCIIAFFTCIIAFFITLYQLFGGMGMFLAFPVLAICRIIYAGVKGK